MTFDCETLKQHLEHCGFTDVKRYNWQDFYSEEVDFKTDYDDFSRAYLPHMDFTHGR